MRNSLTMAAALTIALTALGCGGGGGGSTSTPTAPSGGSTTGSSVVTITITGQNGTLAFNPNPATVDSGGKVQFKLDTVTAVDGRKLRIKASPGRSSDKNEHNITPPGHRSRDVLAPAGSEYLGYFDGDQTVNVRK